MRCLACIAALLGLCATAGSVGATPIVPVSDDEVVETLPLAGTQRSEIRRLRRSLATHPDQPDIAAQLARRLLAQARRDGDPRLAGQALAALRPWDDEGTARGSSEVQLVLADVEQHLHEFARATRRIEALLARDPRQPQAWLMLATLHRTQGGYAASDRACMALGRLGAALHAQACLAENAALRGDVAAARGSLRHLLEGDIDTSTRTWLLVTLAELEERAGRPGQAEQAFRAALGGPSDVYAAIALADLLIAEHRPREVAPLLAALPRSDSVLLRLDMAARDAGMPQAQDLTRELRERLRDASLRRGGTSPHAREQALFVLHVDGDAARALRLARENLRLQREPIDVLVLADAARAAGQTESDNEGRALAREMGLHDERLASR
jgi:hypothetical protein